LQLSASLLALLDLADFMKSDQNQGFRAKRKVLGIDVEIREHARVAISNSFLQPWIETVECDSTDDNLTTILDAVSEKSETVLVILDSDHTKGHVTKELNLYSKYVTPGSYLIVFDTVIEFLESQLPGRSWGPGNSPLNAVKDFLESNPEFEVDEMLTSKLSISCAPNGYLRRR